MRQPPTLTLRSSYAQITLGSLLFLTSLIFLLSHTTHTHADEIHLSSGRILKGKVVSQKEDADVVVVELPSGATVRIPAQQVVRIEAGLSPREELQAREEQLAGSASATYTLATWANKNGLKKDSARLMWRVLDLHPSHRQAREALGFRRLGALWLAEDDYQRAIGNVQLNGKWLTRAEYLNAMKRGNVQNTADAHELLRVAASTQPRKTREAALEKFRALSTHDRSYALIDASESRRWRERQFAAREFADLDETRYRSRLAHMAVTDGMRSVRDEALRVLKKWDHADTALSFIPYVESADERHRINAVRALNVFPDKRAAGTLVDRASQIYGSFGRVHFANVVQRSYVKDYELVSGGTGLVVQEVADPVIDTMNTGVVLDIEVRRVELVSIFATLGRISGERHGTNVPKWQEWWAQETGKLAATPEANDNETQKDNDDA